MTRGLAVALVAGFVAGSVGAQSFAPLPAYAAQAMGARDSRAGWAEAPPLLPSDQQMNMPCNDFAKLDYALISYPFTPQTDRVRVVCSPLGIPPVQKWNSAPDNIAGVNATGSPCSPEGIYSATTDEHLLSCSPSTPGGPTTWKLGYSQGPAFTGPGPEPPVAQ
jgi:hypothetical protein